MLFRVQSRNVVLIIIGTIPYELIEFMSCMVGNISTVSYIFEIDIKHCEVVKLLIANQRDKPPMVHH